MTLLNCYITPFVASASKCAEQLPLFYYRCQIKVNLSISCKFGILYKSVISYAKRLYISEESHEKNHRHSKQKQSSCCI